MESTTHDLEGQVPSQVSYIGETSKWGYQVDFQVDETSITWIKLALDEGVDLTEFDDGLLNKAMGTGILTIPQGLTAQKVTETFFSFLYKPIKESIRQIMGLNSLPPLRFFLSVPAQWSEKAQQSMLLAATGAGIGTEGGDSVEFISEPEAALHYALSLSDSIIKVGKGVLVADLGGGTATIVLTGGFSDSQYVQKCLREVFTVQGNLTIIVTPYPHLAVAMGGASRSNISQPTDSIKAPLSYGFQTMQAVRPSNYSTASQQQLVPSGMSWVVEKNQSYSHPYSTDTVIKAMIPPLGILRVPVFACARDVSPRSMKTDTHMVTGILVQFPEHADANRGPVELKIQTTMDFQLANLQFRVKYLGVDVGKKTLHMQHIDFSHPPQMS
ncbi:hypothetical protein BJX99DRAFT_265678 [Aspergillus californicus]